MNRQLEASHSSVSDDASWHAGLMLAPLLTLPEARLLGVDSGVARADYVELLGNILSFLKRSSFRDGLDSRFCLPLSLHKLQHM